MGGNGSFVWNHCGRNQGWVIVACCSHIGPFVWCAVGTMSSHWNTDVPKVAEAYGQQNGVQIETISRRLIPSHHESTLISSIYASRLRCRLLHFTKIRENETLCKKLQNLLVLYDSLIWKNNARI